MPPVTMKRNSIFGFVLLGLVTALGGCISGGSGNGKGGEASGPKVQAVNLNDPIRPIAHDQPVILSAAKNESSGFALQVAGLPKPTGKSVYTLRIQSLQLTTTNASIETENFSAAQLLPMPFDVNRAGFVRHTGLPANVSRLPRALLPVAMDKGQINISALRNPADPTSPSGRAGGPNGEPPLLWIDLHIPPETKAGEYATTCDLLESGKVIGSVPLKVTVHDFVLPDERHLVMVGQLQWDDLRRLYPKEFEVVQPRLLHRDDERYAGAIKVLDQIVSLAQEHRAAVVVPRLQPTVKWPAGEPPQVDWTELDSVLAPWLSGRMFTDKTPPGYWPLPSPDYLERFDRTSQLQYWAQAASHFDQQGWLKNTSVLIEPHNAARVGAPEAIQISSLAAAVLNVHPRIRVTVPLEEDQVQFADEQHPFMVEPRSAGRLMIAGSGLVFAPPTQAWPAKAEHPQKWLRTDLAGLLPYVGAGGDERDVRLWAWLAFLRQTMKAERVEGQTTEPAPFLIHWSGTLPRQSTPQQPGDPNAMVWFYPGSWFGVDQPVPTIQLKWLRRAEQDYEYLWLARQRGEPLNALVMARLMAKPVEIVNQSAADPTYGLMSGTTDQLTWDEAQRLLARTVLLREPGAAADVAKTTELGLATMRWIKPQERPLLMARDAQWMWDNLRGSNWVTLRLGVDLYNASDDTPSENQLGWSAIPNPSGWEMQPQPKTIPALSTYQVRREVLEGSFDLSRVSNRDAAEPLEVTFTHGFTRKAWPLKFVLPVAASEQRQKELLIDGSLEDWDAADEIQSGPMVVMMDRPTVQRQDLKRAETPSHLYTSWSEGDFYLAFKVSGVGEPDRMATRNFVSYQFRRAWGEDLCEAIIQPVYLNGQAGPALHLVCKPNGQVWVERLGAKGGVKEWQPLEGADIRYAATINPANLTTEDAPGRLAKDPATMDWRGELAIPWKALNDPKRGQPTLLRFNFVQHRHATGESASWAGPIDFGRDESFMGLLHLRIAKNPGMGGVRSR